MCDVADEKTGIDVTTGIGGVKSVDISDLMSTTRALANWPERRTSHIGFVGYGNTTAGNKVLIAVDREYDPAVPRAISEALREKGAHVDIICVDIGDPTKEFDYLDEVRVTMRREPWENNPRRWEGSHLSKISPPAAVTTWSFTVRGDPSRQQTTAMNRFHGCNRSI